MKRKVFKGVVLIAFCVCFLYAGAFAQDMDEEYALGDLGVPDDYQETMMATESIMGDAEAIMAVLRDYRWPCMTPARDQGRCGSCWAFASVGVLESWLCKAAEAKLDLSEQQQVSCNTSMSGCCGGSMSALKFWYKAGPMEESCTGYKDKTTKCPKTSDVPCKDLEKCKKLPFVTYGYYTVDTKDFDAVRSSILVDGPAYFRFDVYSDFSPFWRKAAPDTVYVNEGGDKKGGHAVLIFGWSYSKKAWLCKNSWGETSGPNKDGTFWIAWKGHKNDLHFGMANVKVKKK